MRNTSANNNSNNHHSDNNNTPSRKRRSESSEMFQITSQEDENRMNHIPIVDATTSSTSTMASNSVNGTKSAPPITTKVQLKVRIKRFHSVAHWTWGSNTKDDVCSICQNAFEGVCPGVKYPGEDCPVVWGKCLHAFHLQCINTWLTSSATPAGSNPANVKNSCPICRQEWEFSSSNPTSTSVTTTDAAPAAATSTWAACKNDSDGSIFIEGSTHYRAPFHLEKFLRLRCFSYFIDQNVNSKHQV